MICTGDVQNSLNGCLDWSLHHIQVSSAHALSFTRNYGGVFTSDAQTHVAFYFVSFYLFLNFFGSLCIWIPNDPYLYNLLVCITIIIIHYIECGFYWNFLKSNCSLLLWLLSFEHYHAIIYQKKSVKFRSDLTQPKAS